MGVDARDMEKVENLDRLVEKTAPKVVRSCRIDAAEAGNMVIFKHSNGFLGKIVGIVIEWDKLKFYFSLTHKLLKFFGTFIFNLLKDWFAATFP